MDEIKILNFSTKAAPCWFIRFNKINILIDCGIDMHPLLNCVPLNFEGNMNNQLTLTSKKFINAKPLFKFPPKNIDYSNLDFILISNYLNMLALPFITQHFNFQGVIYTTEPTYHFGKLYMLEICNYLDHCSRGHISDIDFKKVIAHSDTYFSLFNFYQRKDIENCFKNIHTKNFLENINLDGLLECYATSSGYAIGSCNWVLKNDCEKLVYISKSSVLTAHPKPIDLINIRNPDIIILSELTKTPSAKPDSMITEFSKIVLSTIKAGGNVLVPCPLTGLTLDLLECLNLSLSMNVRNDFSGQPPIYFVCPEVKSALAYANIFSEWLCHNKQVKVYLPEEPFVHAEMIERGSLHYYSDVSDITIGTTGGGGGVFRTPCIVLAGHTSLRFGPIVHFLKLWKDEPKNTIIFVDTTILDIGPPPLLTLPLKQTPTTDKTVIVDTPALESTNPVYLPDEYKMALKPFNPVYARIAWCPIDTSLNPTHAKKLLKDCKPKKAVICPPPIYDAVAELLKNDEKSAQLPVSNDNKQTTIFDLLTSIQYFGGDDTNTDHPCHDKEDSTSTPDLITNISCSNPEQIFKFHRSLREQFQSLPPAPTRHNQSSKNSCGDLSFRHEDSKNDDDANHYHRSSDALQKLLNGSFRPSHLVSFDTIKEPYHKVLLLQQTTLPEAPTSKPAVGEATTKTFQQSFVFDIDNITSKIEMNPLTKKTVINGVGITSPPPHPNNLDAETCADKPPEIFAASSAAHYIGPDITGVLSVADNRYTLGIVKVRPSSTLSTMKESSAHEAGSTVTKFDSLDVRLRERFREKGFIIEEILQSGESESINCSLTETDDNNNIMKDHSTALHFPKRSNKKPKILSYKINGLLNVHIVLSDDVVTTTLSDNPPSRTPKLSIPSLPRIDFVFDETFTVKNPKQDSSLKDIIRLKNTIVNIFNESLYNV